MAAHPIAAPPVIAEGLYSFEIGGSERVGADLALQYRNRGYDVLCFALYGHKGPIRDELTAKGIRCPDLDYTTRRWPTRRVLFQMEMWRFLRREKVSALHMHHATSLLIAGLAARFSPVRRTVMTEHALHQLREWPRYRRSVVRYCGLADAITVVAPEQVDYFEQEMGVPRQRLHYIPNGVSVVQRDEATRVALRTEFGIGPSQFLFLFAGRLHETKDLPTLLHAVSLWPTQLRERAHLVLAGDGVERQALLQLSASLGLESRVHFIGPRSDVRNVLMAADAFVMSSRTEGLPMALLEAMASGVPCVATAVGGIPGLLGGNAGMLVPAADPAALAEAMCAVSQSDELRATIAANALSRVVRDFSLDTIVTRYLELLGLPAYWDAGHARGGLPEI